MIRGTEERRRRLCLKINFQTECIWHIIIIILKLFRKIMAGIIVPPPETNNIIYGVHPVLAALRQHGETVEEVIVARGARARWFAEVKSLAQKHGVRFRLAEPAWLHRLTRTANHQGLVARTFGYRYQKLDELLDCCRQAGPAALVVVADSIQDPMNLGNMIRTAGAVGAQAVIIPKDRAVGVTSAVAKAAAGALTRVPVCRVTNLSEAIHLLKEIGLWVIGADATGPKSLYEADLTGPLALVIGSEGRGVRPRVQRSCDLVLAIPMAAGPLGSLNAAAATAVFLYEIYRQRIFADKTLKQYLID